MHEIDLVCRADSIPAKLTIDLTGMDIGDSVHIGQIALPEGVRPYNTSQNFTVATIAPPTVMKAGEVAAEQAAAAAASAASAAAAGKAPAPAAAPAKAPAKK
jgi:large subunit ribosomal protein L25